MKTCSRCGKEKDQNEFTIDNRSKDGRYSWCRLCKREYRNQNKEAINLKRKVYDSIHKEEKRMRDHLYYENNKEKLLNRSYVYCRNASYNITQKEFDEILENQGGVCAICGKEETSFGRVTKRRQPLSVDHDHNTGRIRGLLCKNCNHGLGSFFDDESLLIEAANYLKYNHTYITRDISVDVKTSIDNNKQELK